MRSYSKLMVAPVVLIALMSTTSCANLDKRLNRAAIEQGRAEASFPPAPVPDDCRSLEPHARLAVGMEIRSVLKRERAALDRANASKLRCADFTDHLITGLISKGE